MSTRYLSVERFNQWYNDDTVADSGLTEAAINASETWIDHNTGRYFNLVTDDTVASAAQFLPGRCSEILSIYDCTEIDSVVENGTTLTDGTDYSARPLADPTLARSFDSLVRFDRFWYTDGRRATVTVTAKWGWTAIPPMVVESCKILTADILSNRSVRNGLVAITPEGIGIGARTNRTVVDMVNQYRTVRTWGLA